MHEHDDPPPETPFPLVTLNDKPTDERTAIALVMLLRGQHDINPIAMRALEAQAARDRAWAELYDMLRLWVTPKGWKELLSTRGGLILATGLALGGLALTGVAIDLGHLADVAGRIWSGECVP